MMAKECPWTISDIMGKEESLSVRKEEEEEEEEQERNIAGKGYSRGVCFFSLPIEVVIKVLADFLGDHQTISSMDISCAPSKRPIFLRALKHPNLALRDEGPKIRNNMNAYIGWLNSRTVCLLTFFVRIHLLRFYTNLNNVLLERVEGIRIEENPKREVVEEELRILTDIILSCRSLDKISILSERNGSITALIKVIAYTSRLDSVAELFVKHPIVPLSTTLAELAAELGKTLVILDVSESSLDQNDIELISTSCYGLKILCFQKGSVLCQNIGVCLMNLKSLVALKLSCGMLRTFDQISNEDMLFLAGGVPNIISMVIDDLNHTVTTDCFGPVLNLCPKLEHIFINRVMTYIVEEVDGSKRSKLELRMRGPIGASFTTEDEQGLEFASAVGAAARYPLYSMRVWGWSDTVLRIIADSIKANLLELEVVLLQSSSYNVALSSWKYCLISCGQLKSITVEVFDEILDDNHLIVISESCPHLRDFSLRFAKALVRGLNVLLVRLGEGLISLRFENCKRIGLESLALIADRCTALQCLVIVALPLIKTEDIIQTIIRRNALNKLRELFIKRNCYISILKQINETLSFDSRWKYVLRLESPRPSADSVFETFIRNRI
eukprot:scaffold2205_cov183-Ochromonas_danica.AAC.31